ncbi:DUF3750 domain-containing protein [Bdellovibrio bacteriovorus]|nr:DUF3750 domain-containing protein [Bdellovibrio bacteriovorus]
MKLIGSVIAFMLLGVQSQAQDWRTATRDSAHLAPTPQEEKGAVVQVYAARTVSWRGYFAVHSWIATKAKGADHYRTYHVIGWRVKRGLEAVRIETDIPDRHWFGAKPDLIEDLRGAEAEAAIPQIDKLARDYAYKNTYRAYPGPNSNTFISHIIRNVPELKVELPPHAIGKDWINQADLVGWSESKTGVQFSLFGMLGLTVGLGEGVELNLLGLNFGVDFMRPALKLPMVGRVGMTDKP